MLLGLLRGGIEPALRPALVLNLVKHEAAATEGIAGLLRDAGTRELGVEVLTALHESASLMAVLRAIGPLLETDVALRSTLRDMGDLALGPLLDRVYKEWNLETLELLWRLGETVEQPADGGPDA
jgi:hypothetical protein